MNITIRSERCAGAGAGPIDHQDDVHAIGTCHDTAGTCVQAEVVEGTAEVGDVGPEARAHPPRQPVEHVQRLLGCWQHVPPHPRHVGLRCSWRECEGVSHTLEAWWQMTSCLVADGSQLSYAAINTNTNQLAH